jgi:general secretion pathway protein G
VSFHLSKYAPSTHRFDFAITLCVIGIVAACLLHYLNAAQYEFEKVIQKTELNNLQLGITETWVHKSMSNKSMNIEALKNSNPMLLIASKPNNYIGEYAQPPRDRAIWYFNTHKKQLIYVFSNGLEAAYILVCRAGKTNASLVSVGG